MRKHTEGYVLIYVLVVMVVMGLVATGVLTVSLNNYRAQQAAGQRMQEFYEAEGLAEQLVAEIEAQSGTMPLPTTVDITDLENETVLEWEQNACIAAAVKLSESIESFSDSQMMITLTLGDKTNGYELIESEIQFISIGNYNCTIPFHAVIRKGSTEIKMDLQVSVSLSPVIQVQEITEEDSTKTQKILEGASADVNKAVYESYEISTGVGA